MSYSEPLKAVGGGILYNTSYGDYDSYGRQVSVWHNGDWLSGYSHMCTYVVFSDGSVVHQGDYIGTSGNTGKIVPDPGTRCTGGFLQGGHLHFWLGTRSTQIAQNAIVSDVNIQHLSDQQYTGHPSDNTGPGYFASTNWNVFVRAKYESMNGFPGSAFSPTWGYCAQQSRWLHDCFSWNFVSIGLQNFISPTWIPSALVAGPSAIQLLWGADWKVWTYGSLNFAWMPEYLGRPSSDEYAGCFGSYDYTCQIFEKGYVVKILSYWPTLYEYVYICNPTCVYSAGYNFGDQYP